MENKYYTPSIEEFHAGFEYEMYNGYRWITQEFPNPWFRDSVMGGFKTLEKALENNFIRAKYIDQQDIESLGWEHDIEEWYSLGDFSLCHCPELTTISDDSGWYEQNRVFFQGTIRNKSELKQIMHMTGIIKNKEENKL